MGESVGVTEGSVVAAGVSAGALRTSGGALRMERRMEEGNRMTMVLRVGCLSRAIRAMSEGRVVV